jgi:hypothetical protein
MSDIFQTIRAALGPATRVGRMSGGYVPLPVREPDGINLFIVNCEYLSDLDGETAVNTLQIARNDAASIVRALSEIALDDTTRVGIRFGFYDGVKLRETLYSCTLPIRYLSELRGGGDSRYWLRKFDMACPTEHSTIQRVAELL